MRLALVNASIPGVEGDSVIISGGVIEAVGYESSLTGLITGSRRVDLSGRSVILALHDSHTHVPNGGREALDLRGVRSLEALKARVRSAAGRRQGWLFGRGWDENLFKVKEPPTRWDIDEVVPNSPAILVRVCGHVALLNTPALKLFLERFGDAGRKYLVEEGGEATGLVIEEGVSLAMKLLPPPSREEALKVIRTYLRSYLRFGVTYVNVMSVGLRQLELLREALREVPQVKVAAYLTPEAALKFSGGFEGVRVCGVKVFADGSFGGRTAYLSEPYVGGGVGEDLLQGEVFVRYVGLARRLGGQLAVHAIGDAAIRKVLELSLKHGLRGNRLRVEHASLTPPDVLELLKEVSPHVVIQPHFLVSDWWLPEVLSEGRVRWAYAFRSMVEGGLRLYGSSDHPVEPLNPYLSISAAVTRGMLQRHTYMEAVGKGEAFEMYFRDPCFGPTELLPGRDASLSVLNESVDKVSGYDLSSLTPVAVVAGGDVVLADLNDEVGKRLADVRKPSLSNR